MLHIATAIATIPHIHIRVCHSASVCVCRLLFAQQSECEQVLKINRKRCTRSTRFQKKSEREWDEPFARSIEKSRLCEYYFLLLSRSPNFSASLAKNSHTLGALPSPVYSISVTNRHTQNVQTRYRLFTLAHRTRSVRLNLSRYTHKTYSNA